MIRYLLIILLAINAPAPALTQGVNNKPYRIQTSGREVTIKSSRLIKEVLVWTSTGHRIVENRNINASTYSFQVNTNTRVVYVMIHYEGRKPYTEKIGIE